MCSAHSFLLEMVVVKRLCSVIRGRERTLNLAVEAQNFSKESRCLLRLRASCGSYS